MRTQEFIAAQDSSLVTIRSAYWETTSEWPLREGSRRDGEGDYTARKLKKKKAKMTFLLRVACVRASCAPLGARRRQQLWLSESRNIGRGIEVTAEIQCRLGLRSMIRVQGKEEKEQKETTGEFYWLCCFSFVQHQWNILAFSSPAPFFLLDWRHSFGLSPAVFDNFPRFRLTAFSVSFRLRGIVWMFR